MEALDNNQTDNAPEAVTRQEGISASEAAIIAARAMARRHSADPWQRAIQGMLDDGHL